MFGNRNSYSLTNFFIASVRQRMNFMYFQDDIKLTPSLTVNAGLRYELATPQYEANNKLANFNPATNTLIQASNGSIYNRALVNMPLTNLAPRLGFAYSVTPTTVVRGGYGISFTQFNRAGGENNLTYNGPNVVNATINNRSSHGCQPCVPMTRKTKRNASARLSRAMRSSLAAPSAFNPALVTSRYIPKNFQTGYVQSYLLRCATAVTWASSDRLRPTSATRAPICRSWPTTTKPRSVPRLRGGLPTSLAARRPVPTFGDIEIAYGGGTSNYNSLQLKVEKRYGKGLYLLNSFTWGRTFDLSAGHLETSNGDNSRVNFANPSGDYGRSNYDQPLNNTTAILYDLPYGRGRRFGSNAPYVAERNPRRMAGHRHQQHEQWAADQSHLQQPRLPMTNVTDLYTYRPNVVGNPIAPASNRAKTVNCTYRVSVEVNGTRIAGASVPLTGNPFGNAQRNMVVGPAFFQTDLGLHKAFPLWREGSTFDFRAEAFNVLNKVNYQAPDGNVSNNTYGSITSAYPARQLQLAAKIIF